MIRAFFCLLALVALSPLGADQPRRSFLAADSSRGFVRQIDEAGKTVWEMRIGPLHDLHRLPNGNVLMQTDWTHVVEVEPKSGDLVWQYDAGHMHGNAGRKIEVHAFQRLGDGVTMIAESGAARIIEVDRDGNLLHQVALQVPQPQPHHDTRLVRKLENGNYLVCHEAQGIVREYDAAGKTVWEYTVPLFDRAPAPGHGPEAYGNQCFAALRLPSGNTLLSTGNGHRVLEVTPDKQIVWQLSADDLPGIQLAWITSLQVLPSGNIVFVNCHAGPANPQIIEVTRDKQLVWSFHDFERFGNALTNVVVLTVDGKSVTAE